PASFAGVEGVVIEVIPRKKLVHTFEPKFIEDKPSRVTYEIEPMGLVCKLSVTHDQFPEGGPTLETVKEGWPEILSSLKSLLETGEALAIPRNSYQGLQQPSGFLCAGILTASAL